MRGFFDEQLELLNTQLIEMGTLIEHSIRSAAEALVSQDIAQAKEAMRFDKKVDEKEREIEALCLKLLLRQQPVARDLRFISSALKMITDMERIGDMLQLFDILLIRDISEIVLFIADQQYIKKLEHIPAMAGATIEMVTKSIDAFVNRDVDLARKVISMDDVVDDLFDQVKAELIALIGKDASNGEQAMDLLMIAKYYERIGDHATNIAEWVEFALTGIHSKEGDQE